MSILLIHRMARKSREKTRLELTGVATVRLVCVIFSVVGMVEGFGWLQRAWFAAALLWCVAGAWMYPRSPETEPLTGDDDLESGIAFLRRELQRRRDLFGRWLVWGLFPVLFTMAAAAVPLLLYMAFRIPQAMLYILPSYMVLAASFIIGLVVQISRKKRELQKELDELDAIEKENR